MESLEPASTASEPYHRNRNRSQKARHVAALAAAESLNPSRPNPFPARVVGLTLAAVAAFFLLRYASAQERGGETPAPASPEGGLSEGAVVALSVVAILLFSLLKGLFSMAETALVTVRRARVEQMAEEGRAGTASLLRLIENPTRYVAAVQVGTTLMSFAAATVGAILASEIFAPKLLGLGLREGAARPVGVSVVAVLTAVVAMILGEIAPRGLAQKTPDLWALRLAPFVNFCAALFAPITALVLGVSNALVKPFGATAKFETPLVTREEFEQILDEGEERGEIDDEEAKIITNVFDLSETSVRSVMTPRIDMTALPVDASVNRMLETVLESGHSRIPVYENTIDNIVGIVHAKDLLPHLKAQELDTDLRSVMRQPYFVSETQKVSELLAEMRRGNQPLAIVQDEYAGTEGLITIEDLLEEIVGEIRDEYDVDEPDIESLSEDESVIDARMAIADVNERLGLELPRGDYNTIGGLVFGLLGHEPTVGERVRVDGVEFRVETVEGRNIRSVRAVRGGEDREPALTGADGE
jgi:putative hemolysin